MGKIGEISNKKCLTLCKAYIRSVCEECGIELCFPTIKRALKSNGSPLAKFDTDGDDRRFFIIEIPVHAEFIDESSNQDRDQDKTLTNNRKEIRDQVRNQVGNQVRNQVGNQVRNQVIDRITIALEFCIKPKTKNEILERIGLSKQSKYFIENIGSAIDNGLLAMTIPDKPTSKNQKYITTEKGLRIIDKIKK